VSLRSLTERLPGGLALGALLLVLSRPWGLLPPMGPLLDPWDGMLGLARATTNPAESTARIDGLTSPVTVVYDDRAVPHLFADNSLDLYRAMGYVVARDRLFQMELQTRATAGRLTEWAGPRALPLDREMRTLGLARASDAILGALPEDDATRETLEAFAAGVNARIKEVARGTVPLEFQLLGTRPEDWRPENTLYLIKRMAYILSYNTQDLRYERVADLVGRQAAEGLFPLHPTLRQPSTASSASDSSYRQVALPPPSVKQDRIQRLGHGPSPPGSLPRASNNWVVSPKLTPSGKALLAGDPHLAMTLPSVWYEIHLVVRDSIDVYGATMPGIPGIIIGANRAVAWSLTNNPIDVTDFYREEVDDPVKPNAILIDGQPRPVTSRIERYLGRNGQVIAEDTMYHSYRGPLYRMGDAWLSIRWLGLESSNAVATLQRAARAGSVSEWLSAMRGVRAPSQTAAVADTAGNIALQTLGLIPRRAQAVIGIQDGGTVDHDWQGFWPPENNPGVVNPRHGYAASANAEPIDPAEDQRYLARAWPSPWRALRINSLLARSDTVTTDQMREWQTDPGSSRAQAFLPWLVAADDGSDERVSLLVGLLRAWDGRYLQDADGPVAFELAMEQVQTRLWDELRDEDGTVVHRPNEYLVLTLLNDPTNGWWDDRSTETIEQRDDILRKALAAAWEQGLERFGDPSGGAWRWGNVRAVTIPHVLRLSGLGRSGIPNRGGPGTLSPMNMRGNHGASWRMVFEMDSPIRGWTTYPGGQSGNPASPQYADRIPLWASGRLEEVHLPGAPGDLEEKLVTGVLKLEATAR